MKAYFGFDDTNHHDSPYGTGKLVRWFEDELPEGSRCLGVVRQQLLVCDAIPYTSHNSAACMIVKMADPGLLDALIDRAVEYVPVVTHLLRCRPATTFHETIDSNLLPNFSCASLYQN